MNKAEHDRDAAELEAQLRKTVIGRSVRCGAVIRNFFGRGFAALASSCEVVMQGPPTRWLVCLNDGPGALSFRSGRWADRVSMEDIARFDHDECEGG
ncbi:hypothetical protein [Rhizosaccharibacter radicis]|uniref:Uncharacterized protein n=1 Tax=Rhizosaccharibacter radicis TaxID=2782605 RepID=A0ABT1VYC1_9PROT|nr:hypothetical protein [Acetobacteraceae bacterium KSS12]